MPLYVQCILRLLDNIVGVNKARSHDIDQGDILLISKLKHYEQCCKVFEKILIIMQNTRIVCMYVKIVG